MGLPPTILPPWWEAVRDLQFPLHVNMKVIELRTGMQGSVVDRWEEHGMTRYRINTGRHSPENTSGYVEDNFVPDLADPYTLSVLATTNPAVVLLLYAQAER